MSTLLMLPPSGLLVTPRVTFNTDIAISATTEATANTVVTAGTMTANGVDEYMVIFYCPSVQTGAATGAQIRIALYDSVNGGAAAAINPGSSTIGQMNSVAAGSVLIVPMYLVFALVPSAATHAYSIRAWRVTSNGSVNGTTSGIGVPGYIEVRRGL